MNQEFKIPTIPSTEKLGNALTKIMDNHGLQFTFYGQPLENYEVFSPMGGLCLWTALADSVCKDTGVEAGLGLALTEDPKAQFKLRVDLDRPQSYGILIQFLTDAVYTYVEGQGVKLDFTDHLHLNPETLAPVQVELAPLMAALDASGPEPVFTRLKGFPR